MYRFPKAFLFILLLGIFAIAFACGGDDDESQDDNQPDDDDDTGAGDDDDDDDTVPPDTRTPAESVNPFIGSGGFGFGVGQVFVGSYTPAGMVKAGPDTSVGEFALPYFHGSGYYYRDRDIRMFSQTHMSGIGVSDQGNIGLMPVLLKVGDTLKERHYRQEFNHEQEGATTGYYAVTLPGNGINVELSTTHHAAYHRYSFPASDQSTVVINPSHMGAHDNEVSDASIFIDVEEKAIWGHGVCNGSLTQRYGGLPTYFYLRFNKEPESFGVYQDESTHPGETTREGTRLGGWLTFRTSQSEAVDFKVGISYISIEQARINLDEEIPGWDLMEIASQAKTAWEDLLSVIEIEGAEPDMRTMFYTALYHVYAHPTDFTEVGGLYKGWDFDIHEVDDFRYYSDTSLWDTFRTVHPLLVLIDPARQRDILVSMTKNYEQDGRIPKWGLAIGDCGCMVGTSADIVFSGSIVKGITDFDMDLAWEGLRQHGVGSAPSGRGGITSYLEHGYMAADDGGGSVSKTQEYSYDDYALYRIADYMGNQEDADRFFEQSRYYRNLYNPATGYFQGRNADGSWRSPFFPLFTTADYTEGNAWHYLFYAPHDIPGLVELMGGREVLLGKLNTFFEEATKWPDTLLPDLYYWHGNEPDIHSSYVFAMVGRPDLTQKWARWVLTNKYANHPDGLDGNDDCGTMSAWLILSSLGIYPIAGMETYVIGSPVFPRATIHLQNGEDLVIVAENASAENIYIQSASFDGEPLTSALFDHDMIAGGGEFHFVMGPEPGDWAVE